MAGTKLGAIKAQRTLKQKYTAEQMREWSAKGGATKTKTPKGFGSNHDHAVNAGRRGGFMSTKPSFKRDGLKKFLELTKEKHNNYTYDDFYDGYVLGVDLSDQGEMFNVTTACITVWRKQLVKELGEI